ncbi:FtsK/SpoIIIE domain-containing protein [Terracoccus sp. 273MFTsu3.1]|uniref:FtsK/SpoIIIE domain-containing protein n=1 Tax=Terracoccus sp. 273MFTsu3.1 TaxID=1172188 RepID=UPI0003790757|nr:FtsK/SpoIIIE domain-containing protein [Terracoccus sp. 273MFTsu3.1]
MRLTMTVVDTRVPGARPRHVTIEAPSGTRFGEIRRELTEISGVPSCGFRTDGHLVTDDALVGAPPLLRGALLTITRPDDPAVIAAGRGAVELRLAGGIGAGRLVRLGRGEHVVGRAASADVRLDDPGVSRAHAVVTVTPDHVSVVDHHPTNGSRIDGTLLPSHGARLEPGQLLTVGSTTLILGGVDVRGGHHEVVDGEVRIHRQPRFRDAGVTSSVTFPEVPCRPDRHRAPLLTSLAPVALSAVLAVTLSSPALLLFALMSPVLLIGQWWSDRRAGRVSYRRQVREHAVQLAEARNDLAEAVAADVTRRREGHPDLGHLEAVARRRGTRLWERRPSDDDHLVLRLGTATQPTRVDVRGPAPDGVPHVNGLPALLDLATSGVVGVAGPRDHTLSLVGGLLLQVATWHTPRTVQVHVLADTHDHALDWEWAAHLPHVRDDDGSPARVAGRAADVARHVSALRELVDSRGAAVDGRSTGSRRPAPDVVVLLDGASGLRARPGVADLLRAGPESGIVLVCVDRDVSALPAETRATVELDGSAPSATVRADGRALTEVAPDLPSIGWLESVSRVLAPYVDATPESGSAALPRHVSFVELHREAGVDPTTGEGLLRSWARSTGRPVALLGRSTEGNLTVDLATDGPHVLVGGTTGSGKSELLQSLVTGLAVSNRPDELGLLLVDYKGGSAFGDCARLPHTVGIVTDLDAHLTARALTSLDAEMKRRERLLARASARDLDHYRRSAGVCRELPPLSRLVIVVDEFKALADEFPDFIAGLVRVAALGRSLGLHLVLATQRPAGIVSADMRANVALRIALRVRDRADSEDVVDAVDAASLDPRAPGRACLRSGDRTLTTVQTAYLGDPLAVDPGTTDRTRVVLRDLLSPVEPPTDVADDQPHPTELLAVVDAARDAARRAAIPSQPSPWLPPLPTELTPADVMAAGRSSGSPSALDVPMGLVDVPDEQRRGTLWWRAGDRGHLGIAGGPRSGRSTALVTLALGLAASASPDDLHVHVLQGVAGPCAALASLPHVGTVTDGADPTRTRRVVTRLLRMVDGAEPAAPRTVVLVDGWESLEEALCGVDHGAAVDELHRLLRDGPRAGVRFAVTGGRAILSGRLPGLLDHRLALHLPDPLDLTLAGVSPELATTTRTPGRAIDLVSGHEVQLAATSDVAQAVAKVVDVHRGRSRERRDRVPWRIAALPEQARLEDLPPAHDDLWVGVGGDDAAPLALPFGDGLRRVVVAGPNRSGRSTTLVTLGEQLVRLGRRVLVVSPRRSVLSLWADGRACPILTPHDATELIGVRRGDPDLCLLVDDAELVDGSGVEAALLEAARLVDGTEGILVVAAELTRANGAFRGLLPEVSRDGVGILLGATSPGDGDVLGVRLEIEGTRRPGRGHLVVHGGSTPVQVALVDPTTGRTSDSPRTIGPALPLS